MTRFDPLQQYEREGIERKQRGYRMRRREFVTALGGMVVTWPLATRAQQPSNIPRIGFLSPGPQTYQEAFRQGLRDLGYIDGKNIAIEYRFGGGSDENLPVLARELANIPVAAIVVTNTSATAAAMQATKDIPIVMVTTGDPVRFNFTSSLSRPDKNITGLTSFAPELSRKQLDLLRETIQSASKVAVFWNSANPSHGVFLEQAQTAAKSLGLQLQLIEIRTPQGLQPAFETAAQSRPDAILTLIDQVTIRHRSEVVGFVRRERLPAMYALKEFVVSGGLMSYGVSFWDLHYRAATYVDRIIKGIKVVDLPIEQPVKFEMIVNLKAAGELGLTIPPAVLARADEVIE